MGIDQILEQVGLFFIYLLNIPIWVLQALWSNPTWLLEVIIVVGLVIFLRWRKNLSKSIFRKLAGKFPSLKDSDTVNIAEKEAFNQMKGYLVDSVRVETSSESRVMQLKKIRTELRFIEKEMAGTRFSENSELKQIWNLTLRKAASDISRENNLEKAAEILSKLQSNFQRLEAPIKKG